MKLRLNQPKKMQPQLLMFSKAKERTANNLLLFKIMKKIIVFRVLAIALVASIGIISCSKNDETKENIIGNSKVSCYLKSFYNTKYQLGKSIDTKLKKESQNSSLSKSIEVEDFIVTEVLVGEDTRARGYVVTRKSDNQFIYFIDVDRIDYKMTTVKVDVNETMIFNNIDELDKYISTNEFDLIKVAEQVNAGIIENNKFWGSGGTKCNDRYQSTSYDGTSWCMTYCYTPYYVFWIDVNNGVAEPNGGLHPCN